MEVHQKAMIIGLQVLTNQKPITEQMQALPNHQLVDGKIISA